MSVLKVLVECNKYANIITKNNLNLKGVTQSSFKALSYLAQARIINQTLNTKYDVGKNKKYCTIPKNPLEEFHSASQQSEKGVIYDKKPFKLVCEAGKKYSWCACGKSKNQPLCDGTHKNDFLKIKLRPVRFTVEETKEYYLCNCKQTSNRPFCDGTHKLESVQGSSNKTY